MKKVRLFQLIILAFIISAYATALYHPDTMASVFILIMNTLFTLAFISASIVFEIEMAENKS